MAVKIRPEISRAGGKAFAVLKPGRDRGLAVELRQYVKRRSREIEFVEQLPKTPRGKVQRLILRDKGHRAVGIARPDRDTCRVAILA